MGGGHYNIPEALQMQNIDMNLYRKGMAEDSVKAIKRENAERGDLSMLLTDLLIANFDVVNAARDQASREAGKRYFRTMDVVHTELSVSEN